MGIRKTIFYFFFLLFYTSCGGYTKPDGLQQNADFKVETVDVSACREIPAPRQFAYFSYFISDTAFDTLVKPTPNPEFRAISRGFIMYGGKNPVTGNVLNDLWLFDISNHETNHAAVCPWVKLKAGVMDEPRWGGRMIYRFHDNTLMLMGGYKHTGLKDESTSDILLMNLPRALANDTQRSFIAGGALAPNFTRLKVYGDTAQNNIESLSDGNLHDDGFYENNFCNTQQMDSCIVPTGPNACDEPDNGMISSCGPSTTLCNPTAPPGTIYEGCFFSASCTLGSTDNAIDKNPNGLAQFALLYNPFTNGAVTIGGTEGCEGSSQACSNWSNFDITLENPNQAVGRHELFSTIPFNKDKLSLMNSNNIISFDLLSGNTQTDNVAYRQSPGVNDFIKDFWPIGATLGLSNTTGTITGLRWNIRNGGWEINSTPTGLLVGGTFKQTMPPLYVLDINENLCVSPQGCDENGDGRVELSEIPHTATSTHCYQSNWYGHYQLFNNTPDEEYIHRVAKIDLNSPNILRFTPLENEVPPLINTELVPFRFTSPNPRGGDDFIHDDFMLIGGSDVNGQQISHPMLIGEDPRSGAAVTRIVPDIGPRESVVAVTDTLEQAVFVFSGSADQTTYKISLKDHGLNRNNGSYQITDANFTYKLDDNSTADIADDEWTIQSKYHLRYHCEPSTLCFADKIVLHLLDSITQPGYNTARVFATLPGDHPCNLPAPPGDPRKLPDPDNYCHELTVHSARSALNNTVFYNMGSWNLPTPLADGDEIDISVIYTPDIKIATDLKYENAQQTGATHFLMGENGVESKAYNFIAPPQLVAANTSTSFNSLSQQFNVTDHFNISTTFILPPTYLGVAPGAPDINHAVYNLTNPQEFRNYQAQIMENVSLIHTVSDPSLTNGMEGTSNIYIYSQNVTGQNDLLNNYINCPTTPGEKFCLSHDLKRLQEILGPFHHQDMHIIYEARHGGTNTSHAFTHNGIMGIIAYDELGNPYRIDTSDPGTAYENSKITTHELCHGWFGSGIDTDKWLEEGMCQYIENLNYYIDTDGDTQDDTRYAVHDGYEGDMNNLLQASRGTVGCGIKEQKNFTPLPNTYYQGRYILSQFYFALRGSGSPGMDSYEGYWAMWKDFLHAHRRTTVDSATLKAFMDTYLGPYRTGGITRKGFYSDHIEDSCRGIPLLTLRNFTYNHTPGTDPNIGSEWYYGTSSGQFTVEQVQTSNFAPPQARSMKYFSYIPYYLECAQSGAETPPFEECNKFHVLKNNTETISLTPTTYFESNQLPLMPTQADIVQAERLMPMTQAEFSNRYYCGSYNIPYTAPDGRTVNCDQNADGDTAKAPEDCGMVYSNSFDTNDTVNSNSIENITSTGDVDCNCYSYDGTNLNFGCDINQSTESLLM
ncbi:hypothetical protein K1X76_11670 [bacterium]|nr:hypothetical protein [bacterium]